MDELFSQETKSLIAQARLIAIELGYNYISTMHFFLADCKLNNKYTIRNFAFKTNEEFEVFLRAQKTETVSIFEGTIPLTTEAEKTIRKAFTLWNSKKYKDDEICPYHLFLAATRIPETLFYLMMQPKEGLTWKIR